MLMAGQGAIFESQCLQKDRSSLLCETGSGACCMLLHDGAGEKGRRWNSVTVPPL